MRIRELVEIFITIVIIKKINTITRPTANPSQDYLGFNGEYNNWNNRRLKINIEIE